MNGFLILGSNKDLSLAEFSSVANMQPILTSSEVALFEDGASFNQTLLNQLGGIQKLGVIIAQEVHPSNERIIDILHDHIVHLGRSSKTLFGINLYALEENTRHHQLQKEKQKLGIQLKKRLRASSISSRFVITKHTNLSSADTVKTKLFAKGVEFNILTTEKRVYIGMTTAVQDFEDWSHRDFDRPARDARRGMLPPKLARIMINLTGTHPKHATILDPFCGSGTVLMEAAMLGFHQLIGTDIAQKAIEDTETNLEWLQQEGVHIPPFTLHQCTAANTHAYIDENTVDCIATEPFLGKPRKGNESEDDVEEAIEELAQLYRESFATLVRLLKPNGVIVVASPIHYIGSMEFPVPTADILEDLGLTAIPLDKKPVIYKREGQFVGRNILRFKKEE